VRRLADLTDRLERTGVGGSVALTILRDGRSLTVDIAVVDIEAGAPGGGPRP
jgi:2-alkenal reductase